MEVIKELQTAVTTACDISFDHALKYMKSHVDALVKEAEDKVSVAKEAQLKAETRIQELQRDIAVLQRELQQYEIDTGDLELPGEYASLETEFDPKTLWGRDLDDENDDIQVFRKRVEVKYTALYTNLQTFIQTWSGLKSRVLQHKKKLRRWDRQLERGEFSLVVDGQSVTFRRVPSPTSEDVDKPHSQATQSHPKKRLRADSSNPPPKAIKTSSHSSRADEMDTAGKLEDDKQRRIHAPTSKPVSTQYSSPGPDVEPSELSDASCLPFNVQTPQTRQKLSPTISGCDNVHGQRVEMTSKRGAVVKTELLSSSPIRASIHRSEQSFLGTQDLDEIGDTIRTPMKRRAHWDAYVANSSDSQHSTINVHHLERDSPSQLMSQKSSMHQSAESNARTTKSSAQVSFTKQLQDLEQRAIPALAEDGDDAAPLQTYSKTGSGDSLGLPNASINGGFAQRRLENLLEQSVPSKSPLRSCTAISGSNPTRTKSTPQHERTTPLISSQIASDINPDDEPFRARPLRCLGLEHFKINPARNQGLDYAYHTVVRKQDDRKCISGCTRPGCCGDRFRAMARLGGLPGKSEVEQEKEDQALLQEFVGDDTQLLHNLSDNERRHLLVEARARALANKYGRHRHTHQRAQSPPGFWRTDMPDTQEEKNDLGAAKKLEREKVEERYREAMRPGGLWTWADE
ncbi:DNA repair protein Sae2/CtIP [Penicillium sp. IBT 31633x]|nr:DNA repair protein Sae2/CtIP [Penicillium sp. IBT 31633x]